MRPQCDYFLHERMSSEVSVPEVYYNEPTPPYFFGARAVPVGSPILVANYDHYSVGAIQPLDCQGVSCPNLTIYRPPTDCDRYELVPAAALLTPNEEIRWPLQLRVQSATVYTEVTTPVAASQDTTASTSSTAARSSEQHAADLTSSPSLITFQRLGFEPEFTAYSVRGLAADHVMIYEPRSTPISVMALIVLVTCAPLVLLCGRAARAIVAEGTGGTLRRMTEDHGDEDSPDASPSASRSASPAFHSREAAIVDLV